MGTGDETTTDRNQGDASVSTPPPSAAIAPSPTPTLRSAEIDVTSKLSLWRAQVFSADESFRVEAATSIRKHLSQKDVYSNGTVDAIISSPGLLAKLVEFLQVNDAKLQFECAWALTNVASGESRHTKAVVDLGSVPIFVGLLSSPSREVSEQSIWALGNIAGDCVELRDLVLSAGCVPALAAMCSQFNGATPMSAHRNTAWTMSNLVRCKPRPPMTCVGALIPYLITALDSVDSEVVTDACWAFSYMCDEEAGIRRCVEMGAVPKLVQHVGRGGKARTPSLRALGGIVTGTEAETQLVINSGAIEAIMPILDNADSKIMKDALWLFSNIAAGSAAQIERLLISNVVPKVCFLLENARPEIRKEAAFVLSNMAEGGTLPQIERLVNEGCVRCIRQVLENVAPADICSPPGVLTKVVDVALRGLNSILKKLAIETTETTNLPLPPAVVLSASRARLIVPLTKLRDQNGNGEIALLAGNIISQHCTLLLQPAGSAEGDNADEAGQGPGPGPDESVRMAMTLSRQDHRSTRRLALVLDVIGERDHAARGNTAVVARSQSQPTAKVDLDFVRALLADWAGAGVDPQHPDIISALEKLGAPAGEGASGAASRLGRAALVAC